MRIRVTLEIADATRRALRRREGGKGIATRNEMLREFWAVWDAHMEDICADGALPIEDEIEEGNEESSGGRDRDEWKHEAAEQQRLK